MQSHAGYSRCGLGSDGTDRLVALVRQEQARAKQHQESPLLYGAKITGGGSGGQHPAYAKTALISVCPNRENQAATLCVQANHTCKFCCVRVIELVSFPPSSHAISVMIPITMYS